MARAGIEAENLGGPNEPGNPGGLAPSLLLAAFLESSRAQMTDDASDDGSVVFRLNKRLLTLSFSAQQIKRLVSHVFVLHSRTARLKVNNDECNDWVSAMSALW